MFWKLKAVSDQIIGNPDYYEDIEGYYRYRNILQEASPKKPRDFLSRGEFVVGGQALAPFGAANCVKDFIRTATFIRGIRDAIAHALEVFDERPLEILYVGPGPYATLALPQTTQFHPDQIRFTLIERHQESLDNAMAVIDHFGARRYFSKFICDDAYFVGSRIILRRAPDIVIMEVMNRALYTEPQAALTRVMGPLCKILIPEEVIVTGSFETDPPRDKYDMDLGEIARLNRNFQGKLDLHRQIPVRTAGPDAKH